MMEFRNSGSRSTLRVCIHAQHLAFIHTGARRRAGRIGAANLNAGADGEAARRRNDFENHDRNEIDDNHLRYEQPRRRQLGMFAAPADDHNGNEDHKHDSNRR